MPHHVPTYAEFSNPRLVEIYDTVNPLGPEKDFYLNLAAKLSAHRIIDLGCGTGLLTSELARAGHEMIGVEPSGLMLDAAKRRLRGTPTEWIHGSATDLAGQSADLTIMSGHVAQFFLENASWQSALASLHQSLRPGGYLAFESRNPLVPLFPGWPTPTSHRQLTDPQAGQIEWWAQNLERDGNRVRYEIHYYFNESGDEVISQNELVFRTGDEIGRSLEAAGFTTQDVYGDWDSSPADASSPEMIFIAKRS